MIDLKQEYQSNQLKLNEIYNEKIRKGYFRLTE